MNEIAFYFKSLAIKVLVAYELNKLPFAIGGAVAAAVSLIALVAFW